MNRPRGAAVEHTRARRLLEQERRVLLDAQRALREEHLDQEPEGESFGELSPIDQHQADVGSEVFEREKDFSLLYGIERRLIEVADAFQRLDAGDYGRCHTCGEPISDERLEAMPGTRFCADDESYWEATRMTTSSPGEPVPEERGTPIGQVTELAALLNLDELPHDDDVAEELRVGPEETSIHLVRLGRSPGRRMSAQEIEQAEARHTEEETDERDIAERREAELRRDQEAIELEEDQLASRPEPTPAPRPRQHRPARRSPGRGPWTVRTPWRRRGDVIRVDEFTERGTLVIRAEVPDVDPDRDIDISVSDGAVHITAERRTDETHEAKRDYVRRELHHGPSSRTMDLPKGVAGDAVTATYTNGILEIRVLMPTPAAPDSRRIPISTR
jgi:HSP20 family protein